MKEKIKKILITIAEIGTIAWATYGIMSSYRLCGPILGGCNYYIEPVWAYFLSATLILYFLRKYGK